jgi:hypothetical protein
MVDLLGIQVYVNGYDREGRAVVIYTPTFDGACAIEDSVYYLVCPYSTVAVNIMLPVGLIDAVSCTGLQFGVGHRAWRSGPWAIRQACDSVHLHRGHVAGTACCMHHRHKNLVLLGYIVISAPSDHPEQYISLLIL